MRLLFDENLSPSLVTRLASVFPGSVHVRDTGLRGRPDEAGAPRGTGRVLLVYVIRDLFSRAIPAPAA
ncbi:MAG: DUF5615 family PIN-like protein [Opitutaceae bacterium]